MLLRICLIIALVGGLAATVVNFVKVKEVITNTIAERDSEKHDKETAQADASKAHKDLKTTQTKLDTTTKDLARTKTSLDEANNKVDDLTKQNGDLYGEPFETDPGSARSNRIRNCPSGSNCTSPPSRSLIPLPELKTTKIGARPGSSPRTSC